MMYLLTSPTGVSNVENAATTTLYPNPATSTFELQIKAGKSTAAIVELFNVLGTRVSRQETQLNAGTNDVENNVAGLSTGVYLVKVTDAQGNILFTGRVSKL